MMEVDFPRFNKVELLFREIDHSIPIVFSVLEGNSPGRVFVDNVSHPTSAFLFPEGTFYYIIGNVEDESFCQSVVHLLFDEILPNAVEKEMILFGFSDTWRERLDDLLKEKGVLRIHRKMFAFNPEKYAEYRREQKGLPVGMYFQPIDAELAARFPKYNSVIDPRSKRFGYCLMDGEKVVSECNSIYVGGGEAEIDIHTMEEYQGQGYAQLVASRFIEACQVKRLRPSWACWPERQASWALAKKLGFDERPDVPVHLWVEGLK